MLQKPMFLVFAALTIVGAAATAELADQPDVIVHSEYDGKDLKIRGLGVCSITPEKVSCWDVQGKTDEPLVREVESYLRSHDWADTSFVYGRKNRWLVFERSGDPRYSVIYRAGAESPRVDNLVETRGSKTELVRLPLEPSATRVEIEARIGNLPGPPPVDLPFVAGNAVSYGDTTFQANGSGPSPAREGRVVEGGLQIGANQRVQPWILEISVSSPNLERWRLNFQALDKSGVPIRYVDQKGVPVDEKRILLEGATVSTATYHAKSPYSVADLVSEASGNPLYSNIDPKYISALRISGTLTRRVLFTGLPPDPVP